MKRWLVAMNGAAGSRATSVDSVVAALNSAGVEFQLDQPRTRGEMADRITAHARDGGTHVAVVGGDGTVNLAVNALMDLELGDRPILAVLPAGTGCDLMRTFGMTQDLGAAAARMATDDKYTVDVAYLDGAWGRRYFVNVAQAGVGAAAAQTAPRVHRRMGLARYPLAFVARLPRFPRAQITLVTDKRTIESDALAVIFANAQFFAGGWNVAPRATLIDGVLDIQIIDAPKTRAPALVPKIINGTHLSDPAVRRTTASEFDLSASRIWPIEADGDLIGNTNMAGRVIPAAINLKI